MMDKNSNAVAEYQRVLDRGFQRCVELAQEMQSVIGTELGERLELLHLTQDAGSVLCPWTNSLYETMTRTMFDLLRIMQPDHFKDEQRVNFYFLPGYHSILTDRRIAFTESSAHAKSKRRVGVGLCGDPAHGDLQRYHDCSQARWNYYRVPQEKNFDPASPYYWFAYQQPRISDEPHDLVSSLTATTLTPEHDDAFPEHLMLNLSDYPSKDWGNKLAERLNRLTLRDPQWTFPDRRDHTVLDLEREHELRTLRCSLISLWLHSAFKSEEPTWLADTVNDFKTHGFAGIAAAIVEAQQDPIAVDWGDKSTGRPRFTTCTVLSLLPPVAEKPIPLIGPRTPDTPDLIGSSQSIGSAGILSSIPLRINFISVVRQWVRMVYGTFRSAEVAALLRSRASLERAAQSARMLSHDFHRFMEESLESVLEKLEDDSPDAIAYRRFVLLTLKVKSSLGYGISVSVDPEKAHRLKVLLVAPLLLPEEELNLIVHRVISDIQQFNSDRVRVVLDGVLSTSNEAVTVDAYVSVLLLVGEMVRNYCKHGHEGVVGRLSVTREKRMLKFQLEGYGSQPRPGSSFSLLNNFLEAIELGTTKTEIVDGNFRWSVIVYLPD